jgi:hypothetical protein
MDNNEKQRNRSIDAVFCGTLVDPLGVSQRRDHLGVR